MAMIETFALHPRESHAPTGSDRGIEQKRVCNRKRLCNEKR